MIPGEAEDLRPEDFKPEDLKRAMSAGVDGFAFEFIRETTGGSWLRAPSSADARVMAIRIDSREALTDAAFVALRGERHDGHDHLADAVNAGARLLLVDRRRASESAAVGAADVSILLVDDTLRALQAMGAAHRRRLTNTTVIAVTGSAGKTTTRRLIHAALSSTRRGTQSPKSFNNAYGVPLTLLAASPADQFLVVEVGTNAPGEIEMLGRLVEPDVVVITNVGRAHLGGLGSVEAIAAEKASLIRCRRPGGVVIVRDGIAALEPHLVTQDGAIEPLIRYGHAAEMQSAQVQTGAALLRLIDREPRTVTDDGADGRPAGQRIVADGPLEIDLPLAGEHNAINALAAVAVARTLGVADADIARGLATVTGESMRLDARHVPLAGGGVVFLVNDAYNANPESMVAGLRTFVELSNAARRRVVVLGRMLELGDEAPGLHSEVVDELLRLDATSPIACAWLVGPEWSHGADALKKAWSAERVMWVDRLDDAKCSLIAASVRDGDAMFLKGSRGVALERVADAIAGRDGARKELTHPCGSASCTDGDGGSKH